MQVSHNNIQPDWDNLLMDSLVGQEKKGKGLGVGGVGKEENFHLQPTHLNVLR